MIMNATQAKRKTDGIQGDIVENLLEVCQSQIQRAIMRQQYKCLINFHFFHKEETHKTEGVLDDLFFALNSLGYAVSIFFENSTSLVTIDLDWSNADE